MHPIEIFIEECDKAVIAEDVDGLMENYTEDAILVVTPGISAIVKDESRAVFELIAPYFKHSLKVKQSGMKILESSDKALVLAKTIIEAPNQPKEERKATYLLL